MIEGWTIPTLARHDGIMNIFKPITMQKYLIDVDQINSLIFALSGEEVKEKYIEEWLGQFVEKAIAPHLEGGDGWEDAPSWAKFRTVDIDGTVTFWEEKPKHATYTNRWTTNGGNTLTKGRKCIDWRNSLQQRRTG